MDDGSGMGMQHGFWASGGSGTFGRHLLGGVSTKPIGCDSPGRYCGHRVVLQHHRQTGVSRHRPPTIEAHALVHKTGLNSFPSGHTAFATSLLAGTVLALRICGRSTLTAWLIGVPGVLIVAFTRLYLGAHYLGDVIGAMLYASGVVLLGLGMLMPSYPQQVSRAGGCEEV